MEDSKKKKKPWPINRAAELLLKALEGQNLRLFYTEKANDKRKPVLVNMEDGSLLDGADVFARFANQLARVQEALNLNYGNNVRDFCLNEAQALPGGRQAAVFVDNANMVYYIENRELVSMPVKEYLSEHTTCLPPKLRFTFDHTLYHKALRANHAERWGMLPESIRKFFGVHYENLTSRTGLLQAFGYILCLPPDLRAFWTFCGEKRTGKSEIVTLFNNLTRANESISVMIPALSPESMLDGDLDSYDFEQDKHITVPLSIVKGSDAFIAGAHFQDTTAKWKDEANYVRRFVQDEFEKNGSRAVAEEVIKRWGDPNASIDTVLIYEKPRALRGGRFAGMLVNNPLVCTQSNNVEDRLKYILSYNPTPQQDQKNLYDSNANEEFNCANIEEVSAFLTISCAAIMHVVESREPIASEKPDEVRLRNEDNLRDPLLLWYGERFEDRSKLPPPPAFSTRSNEWKSGAELSRDFRTWCEINGYQPNGAKGEFRNVPNIVFADAAKVCELDDAKLAFGPQSAFHQQVHRYNKNFIDYTQPHGRARIYYYYTGDYISDDNTDNIE